MIEYKIEQVNEKWIDIDGNVHNPKFRIVRYEEHEVTYSIQFDSQDKAQLCIARLQSGATSWSDVVADLNFEQEKHTQNRGYTYNISHNDLDRYFSLWLKGKIDISCEVVPAGYTLFVQDGNVIANIKQNHFAVKPF